jgi:Lon protease-like protein
MKSKASPSVGQFVITGIPSREPGLQLDQVEKIDGRGIIQCVGGRRFSTRGHEICSTKQVEGKYIYMYSLQENYDRAIVRIEEDCNRDLKRAHEALLHVVSKLDPGKDRALISELIEAINLKSKQEG